MSRRTTACLGCQKSHVLCNMERPCERCQKKGILCVDGSRKRAKYMIGEEPTEVVINNDLTDKMASILPSESSHLLSLPSHSGDAIRNIYSQVTKPYPYAQNFNNLLLYISKRLDKDGIFRVCRAISYFRPSLIAVIKNLTEEDLLLKEKCCQRMLVEYKRILSDSGDPSAIWRRTGEILHISHEFSYLTEWSSDQLLNKTNYIYEIMDDQSLVSYWEKYASISFNNSQQSCTMNCNLRTPSGEIIKCVLCFTIKRSIFDIPMLIIGNFLPILP